MGKTKTPSLSTRCLVEEGGFEPPKRNATDLQSAPFGHSGTPPYEIGAGRRIRTPDLLITNQLLYRLSYTSKSMCRPTTYALYLWGGEMSRVNFGKYNIDLYACFGDGCGIVAERRV